jgi:splicing factor 3A subunit 3
MFFNFFFFKQETRSSKAYIAYINDLWTYLANFLGRVQPLVDLEEMIVGWHKDFEAATTVDAKKQTKNGGEPLRLGMFGSVTELEALGMERLQSALIALGLKCGGTLKDRAERLWSVRGKKPEDFPKKLLQKSKDGDDKNEKSKSKADEIAWLEFRITKLAEAMMDVVTATRHHAEKQQSRKPEEKEAELREEEAGALPGAADAERTGADDADADDDDEPFYNPLNVPLGWDGKPIPYWMYKLHGLGVEYKCEVCGNQSYWGRRAFDRHFQEWRHAHGMRCLGVPNTKHFHDITLIADVLELYGKIKESLVSEQFTAEAQEEFEDSQGNVLNRQTYEDLARQGLL